MPARPRAETTTTARRLEASRADEPAKEIPGGSVGRTVPTVDVTGEVPGAYVRLKHRLSALALDMIVSPPRRRPIAWLLAYVRLSDHAQASVPLQALTRQASAFGSAGSRSLARLETLGLLDRTDGGVVLAAEYRPHAAYFVRFVERLASALEALGESWSARGPAGAILRGITLFNAGLFFECHEFLEGVWHRAPQPDRDFYQGLIQGATAFYHFEKGNQRGAKRSWEKALPRLAGYPPKYLGVDLEGLIRQMEPWSRRFASAEPGGPLTADRLPRISRRQPV